MNRKKGKPVLRSIVGRYLPASVTERRKTGFGTPVAAWIRGPWLEEMRGMIRTLDEWDDEHWLNHQTVARLLEEHISGLANHDARLWSLYCLMIWKKSVRVEEK